MKRSAAAMPSLGAGGERVPWRSGRCGGMTWCRFAVALAAVFVILLTTTAATVLATVDAPDFDLEPLVRGELGGVFVSATFWAAFPSPGGVTHLLAPAPVALVLVWCALVVALRRRRPTLRIEFWGLAAALGGALPWGIAVVALSGNADGDVAGPWLVWKLAGPCAAAAGALSMLVVGSGFRRETGFPVERHRTAPAS